VAVGTLLTGLRPGSLVGSVSGKAPNIKKEVKRKWINALSRPAIVGFLLAIDD